MTTLRWSCVLALGCHGDVIGLPLYPTYKCSFHSVNEMAWEQPSPFTTVWLHLYEVCCWLEAGERERERSSEWASVSRLGLCTCMHTKHRPLHSSGSNMSQIIFGGSFDMSQTGEICSSGTVAHCLWMWVYLNTVQVNKILFPIFFNGSYKGLVLQNSYLTCCQRLILWFTTVTIVNSMLINKESTVVFYVFLYKRTNSSRPFVPQNQPLALFIFVK